MKKLSKRFIKNRLISKKRGGRGDGVTTEKFMDGTITYLTSAYNPHNNILARGGLYTYRKGNYMRLDNPYEKWGILTLMLNEERIYVNYNAHNDKITSVAFDPNTDIILTGSRDSTVHIWKIIKDIKDDKIKFNLIKIKTLNLPYGCVSSIAFHPIKSLFATGSLNGTVKLWSTIDYTCVETLNLPQNYLLNSVVFHPSENILRVESTLLQLPHGWKYYIVADIDDDYDIKYRDTLTPPERFFEFYSYEGHPPKGTLQKRVNFDLPYLTNIQSIQNAVENELDLQPLVGDKHSTVSSVSKKDSIPSIQNAVENELDLQPLVGENYSNVSSELVSKKDSIESIQSLNWCQGKNRVTCPNKHCKWIQNKCVQKGGVYKEQTNKN
jgi:hypothetical protein